MSLKFISDSCLMAVQAGVAFSGVGVSGSYTLFSAFMSSILPSPSPGDLRIPTWLLKSQPSQPHSIQDGGKKSVTPDPLKDTS